MYLRFTPGLAIAITLTSLLVLWFTVDVANGDIHANVFSNAATMATVATWLYWAHGRRSELARRHATEERDAGATIRAVKTR
jgi:hypothetical protein